MLTRSRRLRALRLHKHLRHARMDNLILQFRLFLAERALRQSAAAASDRQDARADPATQDPALLAAGPAPIVADSGPSAPPDPNRVADRGLVEVGEAGQSEGLATSSAEQLPASPLLPLLCNGCEQARDVEATHKAKIAQLEAALIAAHSRNAGLAEEIHESISRRFRAEEALYKANLPKLKY